MSSDIIFVLIVLIFVCYYFNRWWSKKRNIKKYNDILNYWLTNIEPKYRNDKSNKGYPRDWQARRQYIFNKEKTCSNCGMPLPSILTYGGGIWESILFKEYSGSINYGLLVLGGHVHHRIPISNGGDHNLNNLVLLCEDCHTSLEGHQSLRKAVKIRNYRRSMTYVHDAKVKRARFNYTCSICEKKILSGEEYYGGRQGGKLCMNCYNKNF